MAEIKIKNVAMQAVKYTCNWSFREEGEEYRKLFE